mmetsp:Transcript_357/g.420  ORF Transcript_357/g.420 Transcript_357/m.420 type:complete len:162 (+) Transcript_357:188-673(+)
MADYSGAGKKDKLVVENLAVEEDCAKVFKELKLRRKHRYIQYGIDTKNAVIKPLDTGKHDVSFDAFLKSLPDAKCRYVVYDHEFVKDGRKQDKLLFITWCPRAADTNTKMLYTTERPKVAAFINGAFDVNAASVGEIKEYLGMDAGSDEDIAADDDDWLSD